MINALKNMAIFSMNNKLIILIGPKGSGKTYIGSFVQEKLDIEFFRVEDVWMKLKERRFSPDYIQKGYLKVEEEIHRKFEETNKLIIETTAADIESIKFIARLKNCFIIKLIKVNSSSETCLKRIKIRDQLVHVPISDDRIEEINKKSMMNDLSFDLVINNENISNEEIIDTFSQIV